METARLKDTKKTTAKIMVEGQGTTSKRQVGKWWEGLSTNLRRRIMIMTKGPKNVIVQIWKQRRLEIVELGR